jgi:MFS transporter, DHA2 family, multidrug resistance protein
LSDRSGPPRLFFAALLYSLFLAIFYNTDTNMAGLYIVSDLGGDRHISVYSMVFFGMGAVLTIPIANPLGNRFGPVRVICCAYLFFMLFTFLCARAPTFFLFNLSRTGLGCSLGPFYILCRRLLLAFAPPERQETYSFLTMLMFAVVPVMGACFGGWLAYEEHWRWIFRVNTPLIVLIGGYLWLYCRHLDPPPSTPPKFDWLGYLFFVVAISSLVTAATMAQQLDWYRSLLLALLTLIGLPSLLFFLIWELNTPNPLIDLRLLKNPMLSYSLINLAVLFSAYFGMIILIALWLNIYANYTPIWISALIGTMAVSALIAWFLSQDLLKRIDHRFTLALAILSMSLSCYYSTHFNIDVDFYHLAVARFLSGIGLVLFFVPLIRMTLASCGAEGETEAFTLFQIGRSLFSSLGAGLYVILWQRRQAFFYERLGEGISVNSQLTLNFFRRATEIFDLTQEQAAVQLDIYRTQQATSLALNDALGAMGLILVGLFALLMLTFAIDRLAGRKLFSA